MNLPERMDFRKMTSLIRAIDHGFRKRIIEMINNSGEMTVSDIYLKMRVEQSIASQHLAILRKQGLVKTERQGKYIYYSLNEENVAILLRLKDICEKEFKPNEII